VFPAPCDEAAAAAIWSLESDPARRLLALFGRYSLLEALPSPDAIRGGAGGGARYRLHDLLADLALAHAAAQELETVRLHHAEHYFNIMRTADYMYDQGGDNITKGLMLFDFEWMHIQIVSLLGVDRDRDN
jgi:hypothetical protein